MRIQSWTAFWETFIFPTYFQGKSEQTFIVSVHGALHLYLGSQLKRIDPWLYLGSQRNKIDPWLYLGTNNCTWEQITVLGKSAQTQKFSLLYLRSELYLGTNSLLYLGPPSAHRFTKWKWHFFLNSKNFQFFLVQLFRNWLHRNSKIILSYVDVLEAQIRPFLVDLLRREEVQSLTSHV